LGPPVIVLDDKPIAVDTRKAIALLAYLAVRGKPSRRESLTTIFWPESDPAHAKAALRRTISALNKGLKRKWLAIDRETVGLVRENGFWMDITEFVGLIDGSNNHHHSTNEICAKCIQDLIKAVDLYRDDFLAGFTLRDSPSFDEWQFFQTEEFRHTFGLALDRLVAMLSADRDYARAIPFAKRRLAKGIAARSRPSSTHEALCVVGSTIRGIAPVSCLRALTRSGVKSPAARGDHRPVRKNIGR